MTQETDIIIVGAGPAGLSLARSLADSGLRIAQIEALPQETLANPPFDGREIALTHPSKKIMEQLGLWERVPPAEIFQLREATVLNADSPFRLHFPRPSQNSRGEPIDTLGYLISNHHIRRAAYEAALTQDNISWYYGRRVVASRADEASAGVTLDDGTVIRGRLLVAADSRFSSVRRARGIPAETHEFGRNVIVFRLKHTLPHAHTASECFFYGSTLALLPLSEHLTNCVITIDSGRAPEILALSPADLAEFVARELNYRFGDMELVSTVHDYPLVGVHARRFYATRTALVGDAACGMHPVTAHGFNLGLASADILAGLIVQAAASGQDIADTKLLEKYEAKHILHTRALYHGTNFVVKLFTNETPPAKLLRNTVLRLSNHLPPVKKLITKQLTG